MQLNTAHELARTALGRFGLEPDSELRFIKYRENHVFRAVRPSGGSVAIRLHRPGYRSDGEIRTELHYVRALREHGARVPQIVPTIEGELFATVRFDGHERVVSAQLWLEDSVPFGEAATAIFGEHRPDPQQFAQIGALLAELHLASERIGVIETFERAAWDLDGLAGETPLWGDPRRLPGLSREDRALIGAALALVQHELEQLDQGPGTFGVIHADATPENILATPSGFTLIDFDDFGTGWFVFDLVTALFHHTTQSTYPAYERALLTGYRSLRPLGEAELAVWDTFLLARGLTYLGWAADRAGDPAAAFVEGSIAPWVLQIAAALTRGQKPPWRLADTATTEEETRP